jgi:hypothetical protein
MAQQELRSRLPHDTVTDTMTDTMIDTGADAEHVVASRWHSSPR